MKRAILNIRILRKHGACTEAVEWFETQPKKDYKSLLISCIKEDHLEWVNWMLLRLLTKENKIRYAIYAATQVLHIFEKKYPGDDRPRKAITAARNYVKNPVNKDAATAATADSAAYAAAYAYADSAAYAAADSATDVSEQKKITTKILTYGYKLLMKERKS
uniref:Imm-5-like domain-containing protein n=1 Tax=viral metagenome TaxID=1070528 RepID=A0A6M3LXJ5_9ZZZZ